MKNLKLYESWKPEWPEWADTPQPEEAGREIEHTEAEQLFTPIYTTDEEPYPDSPKRSGNGQPDFDIVMDKTPERAIWAVEVIEDAVPNDYKSLWHTDDEDDQYITDTDSILDFATDEFKAGRYAEGIESWQDTVEDFSKKERICLVKLVSPEDVDFILEDLYDYLRPGYATYVAKQRVPRPGYTANYLTLKEGEIARVKRAISTLLRYKKRIESNTVGGPTQA
jgi:hypothetical protein